MRWMVLLSSSCDSSVPRKKRKKKEGKYLSTGNVQLNLALVGAYQSAKLLHNTGQQTQSVVLSKRGKEVLENVALVGTGNPLQLLHNLSLVAHGESGGVENGGEFWVPFEDLAERGEGLGDLVEGRGFGRGSVLKSELEKSSFLQLSFFPRVFNPGDPPPN
jgi:hypothetical protein